MNNLEVIESSKSVDKKLVAFEISEEFRQLIRKDAYELGISFSAMLRLIIYKYYKSITQSKGDIK